LKSVEYGALLGRSRAGGILCAMSLRRRLFAALYDPLTSGMESILVPLRERTAGRAQGDVLEIGAGTGANLAYYPNDARLTAFENNASMASRLKTKAARAGREVRVDVAEGGRLPYGDASFDAVVSSMVLCSVADQAHVLSEVRRVLRPGGQFLFLEHVASPSARVRTWQRRLNPIQRFFADGCELDRDTAAAIRNAGFASTTIDELDLPRFPALTGHVIVGVALA
jgi:SAM-dependent methyltransferase